ncbi:MAG TPA: tetratricopeptide repeat protein [Kofleriaceae bacterium]|nr:tetratricopeptide repeat protein [Kofleriaceae bacterium]
MAIPEAVQQQVEDALIDEDVETAYALLSPHLGDDASAWAEAGFFLDDMGRSDEALVHFERALELDARCCSAYVGRGKLRATQRDYDAAIADLDHALAIHPDAMTWFLKGLVLEDAGRHDEAARCRAEAARLDPASFGGA